MRRAKVRLLLATALALAGCRDARVERAHHRVVATRIASDSVERVWKRAVGVDSMAMHGDTALIWISPTNWMATDAPEAIVHVAPGQRIVAIDWIVGG